MEKKLGMKSGKKKLIKTMLMLLLCLLLCLLPFLVQKNTLNAFTVKAGSEIGGQLIQADDISNEFFVTMLGWFDGLILLMFLINIVFFFIEEHRADTVPWRRSLQLSLNLGIIIGGVVLGFILIFVYFGSKAWWDADILMLSRRFSNKLYWLPQLAFLAASTLQMIFDIFWFGPSNRTPWFDTMLKKREDKKRENAK